MFTVFPFCETKWKTKAWKRIEKWRTDSAEDRVRTSSGWTSFWSVSTGKWSEGSGCNEKVIHPLSSFANLSHHKNWSVFARAEFEVAIRVEKAAKLKQVDNRIITLKRDISKLKDSLAEYGTYQAWFFYLSYTWTFYGNLMLKI